MLFSKLAVASILALASSTAAQVVVTVTSTVTIVTVTVTPLSTSTSTAYVTVSAAPPRTSSSDDDWWEGWNTWRNRPTTSSNKVTTYTSTAVVTVTVPATTAPITTCPLPVYNQCGGRDWSGCTSCTSTASCKSSNEWYHQCIPKTPKVVTVTSTIYR